MYFSHEHFLSLTIGENETKWSIFSFPKPQASITLRAHLVANYNRNNNHYYWE